MPLTRFMHDKLARLRALLADPEVLAIELHTRPEVKVMATKLLVAASEDGDEIDLVLGVTATFDDAHGLCAAIASAAAEEVEEAQEALQDEQTAFVLPYGVSDDEGTGIEVRLVEYLEAIARAYGNHVRQWVVALDVAAPADLEPAWRACLGRLLAATSHGRLTWVTFEPDQTHEGTRPLAPQRWHAMSRPTGSSLDAAVDRLLTDPRRRMLTVSGCGTTAPAVGQRIRRLPCPAVRTTVTIVVPPLPFLSPLYHWVEARRHVARQCHALEQRTTGGRHTGPLLEEAEAFSAYRDAEAGFAELCARLAVAMLRDRGRLVIVIDAPTEGRPGDIEASWRRLASAAVSTRVKFVVLGTSSMAPVEPAPARIEPFVFDLGAEQIEKGLTERLAEPDLPPLERLRYTSAAAGWALAKGDPEIAVARSVDALQQSRAMDDPREEVVAQYGL
ncbi:MAG: hypothetical protein K0V04_43945, partial [Deltaproteobacteria bacterium]|nr:hypothetical protein [Deltaproteobacteria bacterium]